MSRGRHRDGGRPSPRRPMPGRPSPGRRLPGPAGLALRQTRSDPWVPLALAVLVVLVALAATAWPRVLARIDTAQAAYAVGDLSVAQRDVVGTTVLGDAPWTGSTGAPFVFDGPEVTWAPVRQGLDTLRDQQPEPLRSVLERGRFVVDVGGLLRVPNDPASDIRTADLQFRVDPMLLQLVDVVQGRPPAAQIPVPPEAAGAGVDLVGASTATATEVMLSQDAATRLVWAVEEVREIPTVGPVRLTGTYVPLDAEDPHWQQAPYGTGMGRLFDGNTGESGRAAAYLAPGNPGTLARSPVREFRVWFTLGEQGLQGDRLAELTSQLAAFTAAQRTVVPPTVDPGPGASQVVRELEVRFSSGVSPTLDTLAAGQRASAAVLAVVLAGPLGLVLVVFALGAQLLTLRRRDTVALARARGASDRQVRTLLATEALVLGVPAAALGYAAAWSVDPVPTGWGEPVLVGCIALLPAVAVLTSPLGTSRRRERRDLGRGRARWRVLGEVAVLAGAALAVQRVLAGDPGGADTGSGVDLLTGLTPALLALAACLLTLRLYPLPLRVLVGRLHRRASLTPFLGSARAVRDPAGGLLPVLAVLLGVGVATSGAVLASTVTDGAERAAWGAVGAQVQLTGPRATPELTRTVAGVEGVTSVAAVAQAPATRNLTGAVEAEGVTVYVVDDALLQVHRAAPLVPALPEALYATDGALPVVTGGATGAAVTTGPVQLSGVGSGRVVGHVEGLAGVRTDRAFVLVTRSAWERAGQEPPTGTTLLAATTTATPGLDDPVVAELVAAVPNSSVQTPRAQLDRVQAAPLTSGLTSVSVAAGLVSLALTVAALVLTQLMGAPARNRVLAVLRTLGATPRQVRALTAWELGPLVGAAVGVGAVLGAAVPWLLLQAVDLRGLTGGPSQPALALDPWSLGLVLGVVAGTVLLAVTVSAALAGRTDLAQQLRVGEER